MSEMSEVDNWSVTDAWVGWYGKNGLGPIRTYHPDEAVSYGPGACLVTTKVCIESGILTMTLKTSTYDAQNGWPPIATALLQAARFTLDKVNRVMESQELNICRVLNRNVSPIDNFTHVKFNITVARNENKRVFKTEAIWFKPAGRGVQLQNGTIPMRATSYSWKEH